MMTKHISGPSPASGTSPEEHIETKSDQAAMMERKPFESEPEMTIRLLEALRASERKLRALYENAPIGIFQTNSAGNKLSANMAMARMLGLDSPEAVARYYNRLDEQLYPDADVRRQFIEQMKKDGFVENFEFKARQVDGREIWVSMNARVAVVHPDGTFDIEGFASDMTDRKVGEVEKAALKARLHQARKMESLGSLAGGIAHDFNNILFPIIGMSELLLEDIRPGSQAYGNVEHILRAATRGSELVKQILAFSRQTDHQRKPIRIQKIVKEALEFMRSTLPANVRLEPDIQSDCGPVMADATQVHQIAMNLITNAIHAMEQTNGDIIVRLKEAAIGPEDFPGADLEPGSYAHLSVSDTGCGIDPAIINKIFEPYFTTKKQGKGTGLGLSVVYGIVKEHKGEIKVYSEIGRGATFNVYLPLMKRAKSALPAGIEQEIPTGHERILLVEDEMAVARLEAQMLQRLGYRVTLRLDSIEALNAFESTPEAYDLVMTAMTMPRMTGDQLAKALMAIRPDIPVIICAGFSERIDVDEAAAIGIKGFVMKPVLRADMAKTLREVLDKKD